MLAALRDLIAAIGAVIILTHSTGQRDWLWKQIAVARQVALNGTHQGWECPSIFDKDACVRAKPPKKTTKR